MNYSFDDAAILIIICVGVGIRGIVSLSSYSGKSTPPKFGDYEAQRHWQEITFNLPANQWYLNSTNNDLHYWGIDYPPLSAYHSLLLGIIANHINSSYVALLSSRGYETEEHKSFMRLTVLASDLLIYIPACLLTMITMKMFISAYTLPFLILILLYPCQILIDNGHFQYNNISLGLFILSVVSILRNRHNWASITFALALNYKQMELYHALPFFVYLLKASFLSNSAFKNIFKLVEIAFITVTTFIIMWIPWISSKYTLIIAALRLFPLNRGVFEDKVANVWCSLSVIYKFKENIRNDQMALICLAATLLAIIPTNIHLFCNLKKKTFLFTLANTSLSFFLLAFHVHEKSILLAAIPICFLLPIMPFSVLCFAKISTLSVFPLLLQDNLCIVYFGMMIMLSIIFKCLIQLVYSTENRHQSSLTFFMNVLDTIILIISIATFIFPSPERLPYFWSFVISFFCCIFFIIFSLESNLFQYNSHFNVYKRLRCLKKLCTKYKF